MSERERVRKGEEEAISSGVLTIYFTPYRQ